MLLSDSSFNVCDICVYWPKTELTVFTDSTETDVSCTRFEIIPPCHT